MKTKQLSSKQLIALVLILIGAVSSIFGITGLTKSSSEDPYESRNGIVMVYATVYDNEGNSEAGMGTGWAIGTPGQPIQYIVTNGHVVNKAYTYPRYDSSLYGGEIDVFFSAAENDYVKAKVVYFSPQEEKDIAILQLPSPTDKRTALTLRDSGDIKIGDTAYALGYPGNSSQRQDFATYDIDDITITRGIISKRTTTSFSTYEAFQMDVSIAPGNSGGPLFNSFGVVVGIVSAKLDSTSSGSSVEGLGFAIPINDVISMIQDIMTNGYVSNKAYLGATVGTLTQSMAQQYSYDISKGAFVYSVEENGAAQKAGLQSGDIIVKIGDYEIKTMEDITAVKKRYSAGDTVAVEFYRGGQKQTTELTFDASEPTTQTSVEEIPDTGSQGYYDPWDYFFNMPFFR